MLLRYSSLVWSLVISLGKKVSSCFSWNRNKDIRGFKHRLTKCLRPRWIPHCACIIAKHPSLSESDAEFPSMPVSAQRRPRSVKAHGKASLSSRMWLRKERSVSVPPRPFLFPRAEPQDGADSLMGNARRFDLMVDAHNNGIVRHCEHFQNQTSLIFKHGSVYILSFFVSSFHFVLCYFLSVLFFICPISLWKSLPTCMEYKIIKTFN